MTTKFIIKKANAPIKYKIVIIVEADDGISLPEEICQRVLADDIETEAEARDEANLIVENYIVV